MIIKGLDMSDYVVGPRVSPLKYDLFAVCNHYGSLQSGHYTTYHPLFPLPPVIQKKKKKKSAFYAFYANHEV